MENYPEPATKYCITRILDQMNNFIYDIYDNQEKKYHGFFCYINYKSIKIPVLITHCHFIENEHYDYINLSINNHQLMVEVGEIIYISLKDDILIIQIKEKNITGINFLEFDDGIFIKDLEEHYNKESIYIINYTNNSDNISVTFSVINSIKHSKILYFGNINSKEGLIFNSSNNKLIGIHKENNSYFCKGLFFKDFVNEYISDFKHKLSKINELNITLKIEEEFELNKKIYFLDNYGEENNKHNNFKQLNEINTKLYINGNEKKFEQFIIPNYLGEYNIKLKFGILLNDCSYMFAGCNNITEINFIYFNTKYVSSMKYMFYNCSKLKRLNLLNFDTSFVTDMNNMFSGCKNLENLDITSFDTKNVKNMNNLFNDCINLKKVNLSYFDIKNVKQIDNILYKYLYLIKSNSSNKDIHYNEFMKKFNLNINNKINQILLLESDIKPISSKREIICPFCPLTPIINIFISEDGILTSEFRCPNLHNGFIPFSDIFKNINKHGVFCSLCKKVTKEAELTKKAIKEEELLYCGKCKKYICSKCRPEHDKEKETHKILLEKTKVNFTCLEHNKNFYAFCFDCLVDVCPNCTRHENHTFKSFDILLKDFSYYLYKHYLDNYNLYIKTVKKLAKLNPELFEVFKKRNKILFVFSKYLYEHMEYKKTLNQLNGEIIINLFNVLDYDYEIPEKVRQNKEDFENYCKNHLILKYKPINFICSFSKNKQDFNITKLELIEYYSLKLIEEKPQYFKYSPIGDLIIFSSDKIIYLLSPNNHQSNISQIIFEEKIISFNILNKNILSICTISFLNFDIIFYKLIESYPYYEQDNSLPKIKSPSNDINIQIIGNLNKCLITRTLGGTINLYLDIKYKGNFEIIATDKISNNNAEIISYELKTIWKKYIIIKNNENIVVRDLTKKNLDILYNKKILEKENDFLVFNGNILVNKNKEILFYNIPYLEIVSKLVLDDDILSINIINPKTMIVVENNCIEQFEVNSWKKLWTQDNLIYNKSVKDFRPIGAGKKLLFYNNKDNIIYYSFSKA